MRAAVRESGSVGFERLSRVLAPIGCVATAATAHRTLTSGLPITLYDGSAVAASALFTGMHLYFMFTPYSRWKAVAQSLVVLLIGCLGVFLSRDPGAFGNSILVSVGVLLSLKNGTFRRLAHALVVYAAILVGDVLLSVIVQDASWREVLYSLVPGAAVFALLYYIFHEELQRIMTEQRRLQSEATTSKAHAARLSNEIEQARRRAAEAISAVEAEQRLVDKLQSELEDVHARIVTVDPTSFNLTERETEVLRLLVTRMASNKEIADELGFTERTAKSHIYNICNKVGVDRRVEIIEMFRWSFDDDENRE